MRVEQCEDFHARQASFFLLGSALLMRSLSAPKQVQVKIGRLGGRVKKRCGLCPGRDDKDRGVSSISKTQEPAENGAKRSRHSRRLTKDV
ncbi:hypothetical protein H9L39_01165 [Fusarium oxysporum f. sp. albedinis]|nr:hypothetical protein H9L39_01165 [Fusarium oxysporum f. sp. albedinis]